MNYSLHRPENQKGVALVVSLVFLLLLTLIGLATMRSTTLQESMANNVEDSMIAFEAAEAALRAGERKIDTFTEIPKPVATNPAVDEVWDFDANAIDWSSKSWRQQGTVPYGTALDGTTNKPRYTVEFQYMPSMCPNPYQCPRRQLYYRITARGTGSTDDSVAILQSTWMRYF